MALQWRWKIRRTLLLIVFGLFVGGYLTFMLAALKEDQRSLTGNEQSQDGDIDNTHYNLPSLDDILNSMMDSDFQKAVSNYRKEHEEIPENTPKVNLVIASTWRSGSTLLGEIVAAHPGVFYHYEPLMSYGMEPIDQEGAEKNVYDLLKSLLECSYSHLESYIKFAYSNPDIFRRNERFWKLCSSMPRFKCYISDILDRLCSLFPVHIMKIVRARLSLVSSLMEVPNTKIIWLVRDPRATMSSRFHSVDWCNTDFCLDPSFLCDGLSKDYHTYKELKATHPDKIMVLRYEDLARSPKAKSREVLNFIGLDYHQNVDEYLRTHLSEEVESPWSTIHDSQKRITRWMKISPWEEVVRTQFKCRNEINLLRYRAFDSESEYSSEHPIKLFDVEAL